LLVVIDSVDTLASDLESSSKAVVFLDKLLSIVQARSLPSQLILHITESHNERFGVFLSRITATHFSSTLLHVVSHPPILLRHLAEAYSTPPPPISSPEKFWSVFTPFVTRGPGLEAEALVFGPNGEGAPSTEMVLEVLYRGPNESGGTSRRLTRGVERSLEGWRDGVLCDLSALTSLTSVFKRKTSTMEVRRNG
jgi:elongator complex protein 5